MSINLKTNSSNNNQEKINFGKALPFAVIILVLILIAYFALAYYSKKIDAQIIGEQEIYSQKMEEFKKGDAKEALDFQNRISESKNLLLQYENNLDLLDEIQKYILPEVYLVKISADFDSNEINLDCRTTNYDYVSKQILSFKNSAFFSKVEAGDSNIVAQEEKVNFKLVLSIKK